MRTKIDICMTAFVLAILTIMFIGYSNRAISYPIDTYHTDWQQIEAPATEDGATFAATIDLDGDEGVFASITSDAFRIPAVSGAPGQKYSQGAAWMFAFVGTDAANETFSFNLVGWAAVNGMAQVICEGDGILGTQDVVTEPDGDSITNGFWADTINLDETTKWPEIGVYNASGDNEVGLLLVDLAGIEYIDFVFYDAGGGAEAATIGAYGRRY